MFPGEVDFMGRLPWHPQYGAFPGQPQGEDRLITLHAGGGYAPPDMIQGPDGLLAPNPMLAVMKQRQEAGREAESEAQDAETQDLVEALGKSKRAKDQAWDQEVSQKSAASAARASADMDATMSQRTMRQAPGGRIGFRGGRGGRGGGRG